ncbi:MAG TPA: DUF2934 domain-containing protein [Burkholderiales bacterium]|jgi:hypothetical protein|nr:DUF2934 domain-containing protein [Burkholderiales bacterium]
MAAKKDRPAPTTRKTPAAAARPAAKPASSQPFEARADISPEELRKLIAEAAYYRAKKRGFAPGYEIDDWVQAEAEVKRLIGRTA